MMFGRQREHLRSTTIVVVAGLLSVVASYQLGCNRSTVSSHLPDANVKNQSPSDQDLIKHVEAFASSDETAAAKAWELLERYDRQSLIRELTRLYGAVDDDHHRVLIAFTFCKLNHEYLLNKKVVLSSLTKESPYERFHGDWAVSLVHRLLLGGDKGVLDDLFAAVAWADGAMATELAGAYSDGLKNDPQDFLTRLASNGEDTRRQVYLLLKDNSLTKEDNERVKVFLRSVPPTSNLHRTAQETIKALQGEDNQSLVPAIQSSRTSNAVWPPPEVTFSSGPADKRINAPSTLFSKRNGFKST